MPYIKQKDRVKFAGPLHMLAVAGINTAGEFNYLVTKLMIQYLQQHGQSYQIYNDLMGALQGASLELYRRQVAEYEDKKIVENGDVCNGD